MSKLLSRGAALAAAGALTAVGFVGLAGPAAAGPTITSCASSSLAVTHTTPQGAAGHSSMVMLIKNVGAASCTLHGYPNVYALNGGGASIGKATWTLNGSAGGVSAITTVTVAPGHYASSIVEWLNFNPVTSGDCTFSASMATVLPATTHVYHLPVSISICRLEVHPIAGGTLGNDDFDRAQLKWLDGAHVIAVQQGAYWTSAKDYLQLAGTFYQTQVNELAQLISLPLTGLTPTQITEAHNDTNALDSFFESPGLYS